MFARGEILVFITLVIIALILERRDLEVCQGQLAFALIVIALEGEVALHHRDRPPRPTGRHHKRDRDHDIVERTILSPEMLELCFELFDGHAYL